MSKLKNLLWALVAIAAFANSAWAFEAGACREDEKKHCPGMAPLSDEAKACMKKNIEKLSDACKANILDMAVKEKEKKAEPK